MSFWNQQRIKNTLGGSWVARPDARPVEGVSVDTRTLREGQVFFALRGERFDAHAFLGAAIEHGAGVLVVDDAEAAAEYRSGAGGVGVLRVDDAGAALARLAGAYRQTLDSLRVVGVTGSNGKTTVVRLIDALLRTRFRGGASVKSYNNAVGVPLTVLAAKPGDQYLVCEVGMNAPGEIAPLARIADPDIGVITSIGRAHVGAFGGEVSGVAREKASLLSYLRPNGLAVVTADTPYLADHLRPVPNVVTFGEAEDADLRLSAFATEPAGDAIRFSINDRWSFRAPLLGRHNALNALSAIAVARRFGLDDEAIGAGLAEARAPSMRMERRDHGGIDVFNDAYNASPESFAAAIETFADLTEGARRRVLVLGDMLELGDAAPQAHAELAEVIRARFEPDFLVTVGSMALFVADRLSRPSGQGATVMLSEMDDDQADRLADRLRPGDAVLIKGSRRLGLERLVRAIERAGAPAAPAEARDEPLCSDH